LAHLPKLTPHLVDLALREHNTILNDSGFVKDSLKKSFILRCIDDIKKVSDLSLRCSHAFVANNRCHGISCRSVDAESSDFEIW